MELQYLHHNEINFQKWDASLQGCANQLIYAESLYLNSLCGTWDAIVSPGFGFMMPFPVKRKFGIRYIPIVPFVQQLGIFSRLPVTEEICNAFYYFLRGRIRLADYPLNYANKIPGGAIKNNFILPLKKTYPEIAAAFKNDLKKDLRKQPESTLSITQSFDPEASIGFFKEQVGKRIPHVTDTHYRNLIRLCNSYAQQNRLLSFAILRKNEVLATAIILKDENRLYNIASAISAEGKRQKANHFLFNDLIRSYSNNGYLLDFEGSDIEGIANFYRQFGSANQPYMAICFNRLPWYIRVFKKPNPINTVQRPEDQTAL